MHSISFGYLTSFFFRYENYWVDNKKNKTSVKLSRKVYEDFFLWQCNVTHVLPFISSLLIMQFYFFFYIQIKIMIREIEILNLLKTYITAITVICFDFTVRAIGQSVNMPSLINFLWITEKESCEMQTYIAC